MSETKTSPVAVAARYVTLPFLDSSDYPETSPVWFLCAFSGHVDELCTDATLALRRLSWDLGGVNISAVVAAEREGITRETGASGAVNPIDAKTAELLEEFLFSHLEQAQHRHTLIKWEFFQQMACEYLPLEHFDGDRQGQFAARFAEFLSHSPDWLAEKWRASGLSVAALIAAVLDAAITSKDAPAE